jgi:hypothetical protein
VVPGVVLVLVPGMALAVAAPALGHTPASLLPAVPEQVVLPHIMIFFAIVFQPYFPPSQVLPLQLCYLDGCSVS